MGRGLESQHCMLDGHFFALLMVFVVKIVCLERSKLNRNEESNDLEDCDFESWRCELPR